MVFTATIFNRIFTGWTIFCVSVLLPILGQDQVAPGYPVINGPDIIVEGKSVTITCHSTGGNPAPTVNWYRNSNVVDNSSSTSGDVTTNSYTFIADKTHQLAVFECQVFNKVLQNYLALSWYFQLYTKPTQPALSGPTVVTAGETHQWTCVSYGGNPAPTMKFRVGSTVLINGVFQKSTEINKTYNVTSVLSWTTGVINNGQTLYCDVDHSDTQTAQSVSLILTVNAKPTQPALSGPTVVTAGETQQWTCISKGGNPAPTMKFRIGYTVINSGISQNSVLESDKTYTVTSVLSWASGVINNGQTLYCDVDHPQTLATQTVTLLLTVNDPLSVSAPQTSYQQNVGTLVVLQCQVNGTATLLSWYFNNQLITISGRYSNGNTIYPSLFISNVQLSDAGSYYCQASNGVNSPRSNTMTLVVIGSPPTVTILVSTYSGQIGNSVTLGCSVSSPNSALQSVSWTFNNGVTSQIITMFSNTVKYSGSTTTTPSLTIFNLASTDAGIYICTATNGAGSGGSTSITLTVLGNMLTVTIPQSQYMVLTGEQITIPCIVSGSPSAQRVFWRTYINNVQTDINIDGNSRYSGGTISSPSLTITNTQASDEGSYTCFATNSVGTSNSQTTFLFVTGGVPVVTIGEYSYQVQVGNSITIGCTVTAIPSVTSVYWIRDINGQTTNIGPSTNPSKYGGSITVTPSLTVNNVDLSDAGNYRCYAVNSVGTGSSQQAALVVSGEIPMVAVILPNYQVNVGSSITLGCTVAANPAHYQVYWRKTIIGQTTTIDVTNSGGKYSGSTVSLPSLTINNAASSDSATYVCYATNRIGTGQSTHTTLNVVGNIPTVTIAQSQYSVNYGNSITMVCTITANPSHTSVYWSKIQNGLATNIYVAGSSNKYFGATVTNPSLVLNNANLNDEGNYVCFATNSVGTGQSGQTFLYVTGGVPVVTISSNSYAVTLGGTTTLQCIVTANPVHSSVTWQKVVNGALQTVAIDGIRTSGGSVNSPSLTITNANSADEGNYVCSATNLVGTGSSQQSFLDVTGSLPTVTVGQIQYTFNYGQTATLVCTVQANPSQTNVYWRKLVNGQLTSIDLYNGRYSGSTVSSPSLTITGLTLSDEGYYQCFSQNSVGTGNSQQTFLDVVGNVPSVQVLSNTYSVTFGNTVTIGCQVIANPAANQVTWQKRINSILINVDLSTNNFNKYSGSTVQNPSLTISNTVTDDGGSYVCSAENSIGSASSSQTFLDVTGSIPSVSIPQSSYSVNIGTQFTIPCTVSAIPTETNIYWTVTVGFNPARNITTSANSQKYQGSAVNSPSLIILNTAASDEGVYRCHAQNSIGTGQSNPTTLSVVGSKPIVTVAQNNYAVAYGSSVQLVCSVSATPTQTQIFWTKIQNGQEVVIDTFNSAKYSGSTVSNPSLTINNADLNDETFYVCKAINSVGQGQSQQTFVDVIGNLPVVTVQSNSYSVLLGQTATLVCTISANPSATSVNWFRVVNGVQTGLSHTAMKYNTPTVNSPNLVINIAAQSDTGYYVCTATNVVGTGSSAQTYLAVTGNVPTVTVALSNYNTNIGSTVTLGCAVNASPSANSVYWGRIVNNQQQNIDTSLTSKYIGSTVNNPSLTIINPELSDEGSYVCYATNSIGTGNSQQTYLYVIGNIPTVTIQDSVYSVNIGSSINIVCNVQAIPTHNAVSWKKIVYGVTSSIVISDRFSGATVSNPTLTISQAEISDEGYYICFATNSVGTGQSQQAYLDVIGNVPTVTIGSSVYSVNYGSTATLVCTVTASPAATSVSWQKIQNGVPSNVVRSGRYSGSTISSPSLVISNVDNSDEAFYVCSASNSVGTGQSTQTYVNVVGSIPVVTILSNYYPVEVGQSVIIQCTVSANPSHTSVVWQKITNGISSNLDVSSGRFSGGTVGTPSLTITNVANSDKGYYMCTASNAVGKGQSQQTFVDVTGSIPTVTVAQSSYSVNFGQAVTLVCTVTGSPSAQTVFWHKNKNGVQSNINSNTNTNKYSGLTTSSPSLTISNADNNDAATYTCFATNSIGTGQSQQTQLSVVGNVPLVIVGQAYTVTLGISITLQCTVFATPSATSVQWNKITNNVPVAINVGANSSKYSGASVGTPSLTIANSNVSDEGYYTCQATNAAGTGTSTQTFLAVQGSLPVVTVDQSQYSVTVGATVTIDCVVFANPAHTSVFWQKIVNGSLSTIYLPQVGKYSGSTTTIPSLTIQNADFTDEGYYICSAQNNVGIGQSLQTFLDVVGSFPVVTVLSTSYLVNVGNSITLQCTVSANPTQTSITWERIVNNVATNIDMLGGRYSGSSISAPSLVISNVVISDKGFYVCKASNSVGTGRSQQTFLDVIGSIPTVTVPQTQYSINRGLSVTLQCSYTANPIPTKVIWEKTVAGQVTTISTALSKYGGSTVQSPSLIINNANESDQASYVCKVSNSIGTGISTSTFLDVIGNIPVVTVQTHTYTVNIGDTLIIQCYVVADPALTSVYWQLIKGGTTTIINVANSAGKYTGSSISIPSLTVTNAQLTDQGTYVCFATNSVGTGQSTQVVVAVSGSVPSVSLVQISFSANYGGSVTLGCTVSANPSATSVYWQKVSGGSTSTVDMANSRYQGSTVATPSLTISNLNSNDAGNYICLAANSVGTGKSTQGLLTVVGNVPVVTVSQSTFSVNFGNTITLDCFVSANPVQSSVYWTRQINNGNLETLDTSTTKYGGSSTFKPSLTINNIDMSDEGTYICYATNAVGTGQSSQIFLDVVGNIPTVTASTVSSVKVGNSVTIQCTVTATPAATSIIWQKYTNNVPVTIDKSSNRFIVGTSLTITSVQQDDQGLYICQAINSVGTGISNQVYLAVTGDPPTSVSISPSPISVIEGQTITATCTAQGSPTISYVWKKDNSNTQLQMGTVLTIISSSKANAGTYKCTASNLYGTKEADVSVDVRYKPIVSVTTPNQGVGGQTVTIQCSYTSNPVATSVVWIKGSQTINIDGCKYTGGSLISPSLTIINLVKSDEGFYKCSVINPIGQGESSQVSLTVDTSAAPSYITITPADVVVKEGESFTLTCDADGDPAPTYQWYHNDTMIYEGKVLTINAAVYKKHDGLYTCKATNTKSYRQAWVDVDVQYIPISIVTQTMVGASVGSPVTLSCDTSANPSATVWEWLYNGNSLTNTKKTLIIDMDSTNDYGTYTCRAINQVGKSANINFSVGVRNVNSDPSTGAASGAATGAATASTGLTSVEIAVILLAILFALLLAVGLIICCCCQEYCAGPCGKTKEKVAPHPQSKRIEKYYEEPEGSVLEVRKREIPRFYKKPTIFNELPITKVVRKDRRNEYRTHGETNKCASDNIYIRSNRTGQYYLPDIEYTYDGEEERRRRRRRKLKNSGLRQEEYLPNNNWIASEGRIESGDEVCSSTKSRRSERGEIEVLRSTTLSRDYDDVGLPKFYYEP